MQPPAPEQRRPERDRKYNKIRVKSGENGWRTAVERSVTARFAFNRLPRADFSPSGPERDRRNG